MTTPIDPAAASAAATAATSTTAKPTGTGALDGNTFLQLLVAQLKYQNPLSPTDPTQFMSQTAQFTEVEKLQMIADQSTQLLASQQSTEATGMLGQQIVAAGSDGKDITGIVTGMRLTSTGPLLQVNGTSIALSAVKEVDRPAASTTPTSNTTATPAA
jgi:flagellar basal-body rod modification protein FlgD